MSKILNPNQSSQFRRTAFLVSPASALLWLSCNTAGQVTSHRVTRTILVHCRETDQKVVHEQSNNAARHGHTRKQANVCVCVNTVLKKFKKPQKHRHVRLQAATVPCRTEATSSTNWPTNVYFSTQECGCDIFLTAFVFSHSRAACYGTSLQGLFGLTTAVLKMVRSN